MIFLLYIIYVVEDTIEEVKEKAAEIKLKTKKEMIQEISEYIKPGCVLYCLEKLNKNELELLHYNILNHTEPKYN